MKIEEIVDEGKPSEDNGISKKAKKKKTGINENVNSQIVPKAGTSVSVLESEDEDGFPVHACDKKSEASLDKTAHESIPKKSQNKSDKADAASERNLKRKSGAVDQDEQPAR